jgi:hypothetical protein
MHCLYSLHLTIIADVMAFHVQLTITGSSTNRTACLQIYMEFISFVVLLYILIIIQLINTTVYHKVG